MKCIRAVELARAFSAIFRRAGRAQPHGACFCTTPDPILMADYSGAENADPPEIVSEHPITAYIDDDGDQGSSSSSFEHLDPSPPATSAVSSAIPDVSSSISGLRERSRTPYTTASADPGLSDILPIPGQLPRAAADPATDTRGSSSKSKGKGKERAVDDDDDKDSRCAAGTGTGKDEQEEESSNSNDKDALFACHICLETPRADDCVVTKCGHVFCCEPYRRAYATGRQQT